MLNNNHKIDNQAGMKQQVSSNQACMKQHVSSNQTCQQFYLYERIDIWLVAVFSFSLYFDKQKEKTQTFISLSWCFTLTM